MENTFIVRVITSYREGSGFLINSEENDESIVITCAHCIEKSNKKDIKVNFNGIIYYAEEYFVDQETDIAAILLLEFLNIKRISIKKTLNLDNTEFFIGGYPKVTNIGENDSRHKYLNCSLRAQIFNNQDRLTLKLHEKINDTSSESEKEKLDGFSGSPVFCCKDSCIIVIGMLNEIESNNGHDVNYNDVKAIRIEDILYNLYKNGIILYYLKIDGVLNIKWIYKDKNQFSDYLTKKALVIGGSGAGKSSFIKTFAMNSNLLDSSGDGQTTRTDIEYKFSINNEKPTLEVTLLNKDNFICKMINQIEFPLLTLSFWLLLNEKYNIEIEIDIAIKRKLRKLNEIVLPSPKIIDLINSWYELNENNDDNKRRKLIDLNYDFILILLNNNDLCSVNLDEKLTDIEKNELNKILLTCKGFFKHTEFDFLKENNNQEEKENSQKIEDIFDKIFENTTKRELIESIIDSVEKKGDYGIKLFFKMIYEMLQPQVHKYYGVKTNDFSLDLMELKEQHKQSISYLLKVEEGYSLTSMLSKIVVNDKFNNRYAWIIDKLKIKEIWLIDTCGLDHVERGETPVEIIKEAFSKRNDDIKAVFYVKKLDSGRPTELQQIIPAIYKVQSNAAVYCILNGADILYGSHDNQESISFDDELKRPNSIKYLLSEDGKTEIIQSIKENTFTNGHSIGEGRCKILYSVLTKNLIPYCSKIENRTFNLNNEYHINRLFKSIAVEEHLGLDFITEDVVKYVENSASKFDSILKSSLEKIFEKASITDWTSSISKHGHWALKNANIDRIVKHDLGHFGKYDDRWSIHFKDAYQSVFSVFEKDQDIVKELFGLEESNKCSCYDKLESILIDFKDDFLGCPKNEIYKIFPTTSKEIECESCKENCFRNILIKIYASNSYKYSLEYNKNIKRETWLNEICNFSKGFETISNELIQFFKLELLKKMKNENNKNLSLILELNSEIEKDYKRLKEKIVANFLGTNENENVLCKKVLNYIDENKN